MSVQAIAWVLDHSTSRGTARCVLISIANHVDPDGVGWVHVRRVMQEANCSYGAYASAVKAAVECGELVRESHAGGSARLHDRHRPNLFTFPGLAGGAVTAVEQEPDPGPGADVRRVFEAWQEATGKQRAKLSADRRSKITARLREGYTVDELVRAVEGVARSPWHMGDNPAGTRYDDLTLVLRDGTHTERFMALAESPATPLGGHPREGLRNDSRRVSPEDSPVLARLQRGGVGCDRCDVGWVTYPNGTVARCEACDGRLPNDEVPGVQQSDPAGS